MTAALSAVKTAASALVVDGVTVRFAGVTALDAVSFEVAPGAIHAVIGPNGAGKSTTFNVVSGAYRPASGAIRFRGADLTRLPPHRIAALGVARTFQNIALMPAETVEENLLLGRHRLTRAGFVTAALGLPATRRETRRHRARVAEIAEYVGLGGKLTARTGGLSYGDQKRVEIGRALCAEPDLLLLDEPAAGMNAAETAAMAHLIRDIRSDLGIAVLLVEHDMGLVMGIADRITVLDFGRRIADGTPEQVQRDPAVQHAYLGTGTAQSGGLTVGAAGGAFDAYGNGSGYGNGYSNGNG
jgi:branched-chain amino acid transport system ATP-binding protein